MKFKPSEYSVERELLLDHLRGVDEGCGVTYADLSEVAGVDVQEKRHVLSWALKRLQDEGVLFGTVRGTGLKRLTQAECVQEGERLRARAHRQAKRAMKRAVVVGDVSQLSDEQIQEFNATVSQLSVVQKVTSLKAKKAIRKAVAETQHKLPSASVLRLFIQ